MFLRMKYSDRTDWLSVAGALKTRDWKTRHQITGVENAGPENGGTSKLWKAVAVKNVQHS